MYKNLILIVIVLLAGWVPASEEARAASATRSVAPMEPHPSDPREPRKRDRSQLTRNDGGIVIEINTSNLDAATYTVWWVIFNNPEYCAALPCTSADLPGNGGDTRVEASVLWADGGLVGARGRGRFVSGLAAGVTKDALFGPGLLDPRGAEVHVLVRTHGTEILELMHEQITTPGGGCPPNSCLDQQFSVHLP